MKRVFAFARVESRSRTAIKQLLSQHETTKDHFTNQEGTQCISCKPDFVLLRGVGLKETDIKSHGLILLL